MNTKPIDARLLPCAMLAAALLCGCGADTGDTPPAPRPNILLIVADDLGYADLGVFGSDIRTPNIDAIASRGIVFTQFHTASMCAPTRAMLLSGNNNHIAGMARQSATGPLQQHLPGYEAHLSERIAPISRLLRDAGYHTYSVGKWHLGRAAKHSPRAAGFTRSFHLLDGAANHFDATGFFEGGSKYRLDGEEAGYPEGSYSTEVYTDRLIEFIDADAGDGRPVFAFAAYTSPHWPLQVPDDYLERYRGRYDAGYDVLREQNFAALQRKGIVPPESALPPRNDAIPHWAELDPETRRLEAREMELYAAMVENLDHHVGRLIAHLDERGLLEDTLVLFMSDNGAAGEDFYEHGPFVDYLRAHYDNAWENLGRRGSWVSYGPAWAEAGSAPFSRYKGFAREGGIVAPLIVAGPGVPPGSGLNRSYLTVMDLAPTFLTLAGAAYPDDGSLRPMLGESLVPLLAGESEAVHGDDYVTVMYHQGHACLRRGRWKLVTLELPFDESGFALFDLLADPGETTDLSQREPARYAEMLELWRVERVRLGIVLPEDL
ncbi:MAG: arylsulfatase [Woeseiaceae bacterium]